MARTKGTSGIKREPKSAATPHKNLITKGKKIRLWINQRAPDCLKSLRCKSTSNNIVLIKDRSFELVMNLFLFVPLAHMRPENKYEKIITMPARKNRSDITVVVSPIEKVPV
jgi:hypothetical protein